MQNLLDDLTSLLEAEQEFFSDGKILKNLVIEAALRTDQRLLTILMKSETIKKHFFTEISEEEVGSKKILIFDKVKFQDFVSNKKFLPDSYTAFKNRIGLKDRHGQYLSQSQDVVLAWPYKECVLEGGMIKEDQGRTEVFWNTTLAPDDITRLFEPKVLTGWERWDAEAVAAGQAKPVEKVSENDNLLIKGNNLLALHSLKVRYTGKVKLIYIDPPYNTGNDSFLYNDQFKHSSWLTFMRNRLEISYDLLSCDGALVVQCDDNEQAYLKVLLDEIFQNGFVNSVAVKMSGPSGIKMAHKESRLPKFKEYLLIYKKSSAFKMNPQRIKTNKWDREYADMIHNVSREELDTIKQHMVQNGATDDDIDVANKILEKAQLKKCKTSFRLQSGCSDHEQYLWKNSWRIIATKGSNSVEKLALQDQHSFSSLIRAVKSSRNILCLYITNFNRDAETPRVQVVFADQNLEKTCGDFWEDIKTTGGIAQEGGVRLPNGKKPEALLKRIIELTTKPSDLVLDFFAGSGTTAAVAMKADRRWIAVEQLNSNFELAKQRLKNVIAGDHTGVSNEYGWRGGGEFICTEIAAFNSAFIDRIQAALTMDDLLNIYKDMSDMLTYLRYEIDLNSFDEDNLTKLSLEDAKRALMDCLDANHLYVNLNSLDDTDFSIPDKDAKTTKLFYGVEQ